MTRALAICYFSGTGNTEYVVELARDAFARAGVAVDTFRIEDLRRGADSSFDPTAYDMLGIAHPVLGFDCPRLVREFVQDLPQAMAQPVFILKTAGDYHAVNHSSSHVIKRVLIAKGYDPFYDEIVAMPSNWLVAYDDRLNRELVRVAPERVEVAVRHILAKERRALSNHWPARLLLGAASVLEDRYGARAFGRSLQAGASCTRCGLCARECPSGNIRLSGGTVSFGDECVWCMRCVYNCPVSAIGSKRMGIFILKRGYSLANTKDLTAEPIDFEADGLPFWHRYFRRYFVE